VQLPAATGIRGAPTYPANGGIVEALDHGEAVALGEAFADPELVLDGVRPLVLG